MTVTLESLRKSRNQDYTKLTEQINKAVNPNSGNEDKRFWKPQRGKDGNGAALIRFLSNPTSEELPFATEWSHSFQGPSGKWYIQKSLTTYNLPDPVYEANGALYAIGTDESKKLASARKRSLSYIANILVIDDKANPENNGKIFLYRYGKKIFDKILAKQNPTFATDKPLYVWDVFDGADFKMKIKTIKENGREWPNYDDSEWASPTPLFNGDEERILGVVNTLYDLSEFRDPSKAKTYGELKTIFESVIGAPSAPGNTPSYNSAPSAEPQEAASRPEPEAFTSKQAEPVTTSANAFDAFDDDIPF